MGLTKEEHLALVEDARKTKKELVSLKRLIRKLDRNWDNCGTELWCKIYDRLINRAWE
jgi:hypothetical protein